MRLRSLILLTSAACMLAAAPASAAGGIRVNTNLPFMCRATATGPASAAVVCMPSQRGLGPLRFPVSGPIAVKFISRPVWHGCKTATIDHWVKAVCF